MPSKTYIERNLRSLGHKYRKSKTRNEPLFFAKLAIIELCGWIEITQDQIVSDCAARCLNENGSRTKISTKIQNNYGFTEQSHFKPMLISVIGWKGLETIEAQCNPSLIGNLYRNLNELSKERNKLAHSYVKGMTLQLEGPDLTLRRFEQVHSGLVHMEQQLKAAGF